MNRIWPLILGVCLLFFALGTGGWWLLSIQQESREQEVTYVLESISRLKAAEIQKWRSDREKEMVIAASGQIPDFLRKSLNGDGVSTEEMTAYLLSQLRQLRKDWGLLDIAVVDSRNRVLVGELPGRNLSIDPYARRVLDLARSANRVEIGDLHLDDLDRAAISIAAPLSEKGAIIPRGAMLIAKFDPFHRLYPLLNSWPTPTFSAEHLLVSQEGGRVYYLSNLRAMRGAGLRYSVPVSDETIAARAVRGEVGIFEGVDYRGVSVIANAVPIPESNWVLISKISVEEAFLQLRREALMGFVLLMLVLVTIIVGALALLGRAVVAQKRRLAAVQGNIVVQNDRLMTLLRIAPMAVLRDSVFLQVGQGFCNLTGYGASTLIEHGIALLYETREEYESAARNFYEKLNESAHNGVLMPGVETQWKVKDGRLIDIIVSGALVENKKNKTKDLAMIVFDNTSSKTQERMLHRRALELERSNKELMTFAYVASHDLRAPLRAIDQIANWMEEDMGDSINLEVKGHLRLMKSRISRMEALLEDLLTYSQVGQEEGGAVLVDMRKLCLDIFDLLAPPPEFKLDLAGDLPCFVTLETPLTHVMRNLIGNAVKHHNRKDGLISVSVRTESEGYVFSVADDGPGVAPQFHERIFGLFQTLRPRDEVEGSGMGLAFIKKTVEHYDGWIKVESDGKSGTAFHFWWPNEEKMREILESRKA